MVPTVQLSSLAKLGFGFIVLAMLASKRCKYKLKPRNLREERAKQFVETIVRNHMDSVLLGKIQKYDDAGIVDIKSAMRSMSEHNVRIIPPQKIHIPKFVRGEA